MGRAYVERLTMTVRGDPSKRISLVAVDGDPNGIVRGDAGDHAFEVNTDRTWICRGGTVWSVEVIGYAAETPSDWGGSPPTDKASGLDRLAAAYVALTSDPVP